MKKHILLAMLASGLMHIPSSGQITMHKAEEKAAKKDERNEQRSKRKQDRSDKKKDKKLTKKLNRDFKNGRSDIPN